MMLVRKGESTIQTVQGYLDGALSTGVEHGPAVVGNATTLGVTGFREGQAFRSPCERACFAEAVAPLGLGRQDTAVARRIWSYWESDRPRPVLMPSSAAPGRGGRAPSGVPSPRQPRQFQALLAGQPVAKVVQ
jgi:hypothetical protein